MIERGGEPEKNCRLPIDDCRLEKASDQGRATSDRIGVAEILDTHSPDAFRMKRFVATLGPGNQKSEIRKQKPVTAIRLFRPPVAAQVTLRAGKPVRVACEAVMGEITWCAGPWKSSGEWWTDQPWAREEWDVCVGEAAYRIYREPRGWYVEGTYD
jgi:protein ImuB